MNEWNKEYDACAIATLLTSGISIILIIIPNSIEKSIMAKFHNQEGRDAEMRISSSFIKLQFKIEQLPKAFNDSRITWKRHSALGCFFY